MTEKSEFSTFDRTMRDLMSVPHSEIKAALDAEKAAKKKRKAKKRPSAGCPTHSRVLRMSGMVTMWMREASQSSTNHIG